MRPTAIRSIRAFCVECIGGVAYVEECTATRCQLYPFRMGRNPNYSEAARERAREKFLQNNPFTPKQVHKAGEKPDRAKSDAKRLLTSASQKKK